MSLTLPKPHKLPPNARGARVIQVIEVVTKEGAGTDEDPVREVTLLYSFDGELLAVDDPHADTQPAPVHNECAPDLPGIDLGIMRPVTRRQ